MLDAYVESVQLVLFDGSFLRDMVGILCWVEAACAATTEAPHKRWSRRGGIPGELLALPAVGPVTLCSQKKSSPFRTIVPPVWGMVVRFRLSGVNPFL